METIRVTLAEKQKIASALGFLASLNVQQMERKLATIERAKRQVEDLKTEIKVLEALGDRFYVVSPEPPQEWKA